MLWVRGFWRAPIRGLLAGVSTTCVAVVVEGNSAGSDPTALEVDTCCQPKNLGLSPSGAHWPLLQQQFGRGLRG